MVKSGQSSSESDPSLPLNQNFQVERSDIENSQIGGQAGENIYQTAGNHVARDLIQHFYNSSLSNESQLTKEQLRQFEELSEIQNAKFQETLEQARSLMRRIRSLLEKQIGYIKSRKDKNELLELINELQSFLGEEDKLEKIIYDERFDLEAATWLHDHISEMANAATVLIFSRSSLPTLRDKKLELLSVDELRSRFNKTISIYMRWIRTHIVAGTEALCIEKQFKAIIYLDFSNEVYIEAFRYIQREFILALQDNGSLSKEAIRSIVSYIGRFLIERDFNSDA